MSDAELFEHATNLATNNPFGSAKSRAIGEWCYFGGANREICSLYLFVNPSNVTGYTGWPRNIKDEGTGCIVDEYCWYLARG